MAHQITLSDEDYAALAAARTGSSLEETPRRAITEQLQATARPS